jgi:hypothetical protein
MLGLDMKKILGILIFSLLLSGNVFASCSNFVAFTWNHNNKVATFEFKSTSEKTIYITDLYIYKDKTTQVKKKEGKRYIASMVPYGKTTATMSVSNLNLDFVKQATYSCAYEPKKLTAAQKKQQEIFYGGKKKSWFKWWYILVGLGILGVIGAILDQAEKDNKKGTQSKSSKTKLKTANVSSSNNNLVENVWNGLLPLGETFWIYYIIINGIISFGAGFLAEMNDNNIFLIAALGSNIWAGVGTWNSSTNYQLQKIKAKQPYGWAYVAKVLIVLNFLAIAGQAILLFNL